jgi:hypothetical protein
MALVVTGLAAVVGATASVTGHSLGTPPWNVDPSDLKDTDRMFADLTNAARSCVVGAIGLALVSFGAWPRRRRRDRHRNLADREGGPGETRGEHRRP